MIIFEYKLTATTRKEMTEEESQWALNEICSQLEKIGFETTYKKVDEWNT